MEDAQAHWESVYGTKAADQVSWFRPHLETSLSLIERAAPDRASRIIDVGGGESTLVDDLLARGYRNLTVLDISRTALDVTEARLGALAADCVAWLAADVTTTDLPANAYDIWHDRAVFTSWLRQLIEPHTWNVSENRSNQAGMSLPAHLDRRDPRNAAAWMSIVTMPNRCMVNSEGVSA